MPTITRTWLAFAAIGTGLIHFSLVPVRAWTILLVTGQTVRGSAWRADRPLNLPDYGAH